MASKETNQGDETVSKIDTIFDTIFANVYNPTYTGIKYLKPQAKAEFAKIIEQELLWGGAGGEPYPNDAEFILKEQTKRLKELMS